ncbi:Regulator of chromosome condensation 1/beta-lactamase-inhibitor protein II [Phytophthora cactorum]|nr:Regulator of chromosome condensation 1/beta-lactamase-inhibitor protein II [Phytophthora cactorum]
MKGINVSPKASPLPSRSHKDLSSRQQQTEQLQTASSSLLSVVALRRRCSPCYYCGSTPDADTHTVDSNGGAEVRNCSRLYCSLFTKEAGNFVVGSTYFGEKAKRNHQNEKDEYGITAEKRAICFLVGLRNVVAVACNRVSFAASTGRKMHQWRAPEGIEDSSWGQDARHRSKGDCFGLLGGKPLLARTKTIADVGDLRQIAAGELYSWESASSSSIAPPLGRGCATPEQVPWFPSPEKVSRVACGRHHTLVLTSSGIYAWGSNIYGQLGLGYPHQWLPVDGMLVLDIACGDVHSVALTAAGQVFTFGCNWEGQLGIDEHTKAKIADVVATGCAYEPVPVLLPQEPETDKKVYLITAGPQSTAVVAKLDKFFNGVNVCPAGLTGCADELVAGCLRISRLSASMKARQHPACVAQYCNCGWLGGSYSSCFRV